MNRRSEQSVVEVLAAAELGELCLAKIAAVSPMVRVSALNPDGLAPYTAKPQVLFRAASTNASVKRSITSYPSIEWLHTSNAGVDQLLPHIQDFRGVITSSRGVYAQPIAEWVIAMVLTHVKRLPLLMQIQAERRWSETRATEAAGKTMGIIGAGGIGRRIAAIAQAVGMKTLGIRTAAVDLPEFDRVLTPENLEVLLGQADFVVVACPLTQQTRGLIGERELRAMQPSAVLINVARGPIVRTMDLLQALDEGWIAGACLDVTDPEPLPADHPLWSAPNVIITPHMSASSETSLDRIVDFFCDNLRRWIIGEPLLNVVDRQRGY